MSTLVLTLLVVIAAELTILIYQVNLRHRLEETIDPMFSAFSRYSLFQTWTDIQQAKMKYEDASAKAGFLTDSFTRDIAVAEEFWEAECELQTCEDSLDKKYQANFSALRGEDMRKVRDEYHEWLRHRMTVETLALRKEARERFLKRDEKPRKPPV